MEFSDVIWKFIESFLVAIIPVFIPLLAAWLLPKAIGAWAKLKEESKIDPWILEQIVSLAVKAAEQSQLGGLITDKKAYALDFATLWLKERGIKLDLALLDGAIEAAVLDEFNKNKAE